MAKILIIDDEPEVRFMLRKILEKAGYTVVEAANGSEGLRIFREQKVDLIITDIIMPEKDGLETITELHSKFPDAKIVAISGGGRGKPENYLRIAYRLGAAAIIFKPFTREEVLEPVEALLS